MNGKIRKAVLLSIGGGVVGGIAILVLALGTTRAVAERAAQNGTPPLISYQGYVTDKSGQPISDTVALRFGLYEFTMGGSPLWEETQSNIAVQGGHFSTLIGKVNPLGATDFDSTTRYLQVSVDTGAGFVDLPRQQLAAVPYAFQAQAAQTASTAMTATTAITATQAPWSGLSGVPTGFADGVDDDTTYSTGTGLTSTQTTFSVDTAWFDSRYQQHIAQVVVVAKSGGDYASITEALNDIAASSTNPYLVWVAPGSYNEQVTMKEYVHLQGAGPGITVISSTVSSTLIAADGATLALAGNARLSDLSVVNEGIGDHNIAVYANGVLSTTVVDNVTVLAASSSGVSQYGIYSISSTLAIQNSTVGAEGGANTYGIAGNFSSHFIQNSTVNASGGTINRGIDSSLSSLTVQNSTVSANGGTYSNGIRNSRSSATIRDSTVGALGAANNDAIYNTAFGTTSYRVIVNDSQIKGGTYTIRNDIEFQTFVATSQLFEGAIILNSGPVTCAGVYDHNYTFYANTCPNQLGTPTTSSASLLEIPELPRTAATAGLLGFGLLVGLTLVTDAPAQAIRRWRRS